MWIGAIVWLAAAAAAPTLDETRRLFESGRCDEGRKAARKLLESAEARGRDSLEVAAVLDVWVDVAGLCRHARDRKTMAMAERAVAIKEKALGEEHAEVATSLLNLARLIPWDAKDLDLGAASEHLKRALAIREKALGPDHPLLIPMVENLLMISDLTGTLTVGEQHDLRARLDRLWKKAGPDPPRWFETVARADRIEVARLAPDVDHGGPGFPLYPYGSFAKVLDTRTVSWGELAPFVERWRGVIEKPGSQARCHHPAYGLRFLRGEERLIETSLCFQCNNLSLPSAAGNYRWASMTDDKAAVGRLQSALEALFSPAAAAAPTSSPKAR